MNPRYRVLLLLSPFITASIVPVAQAATYYISKSAGSDSKIAAQAQSKSTPWAHLPGMQSCTANCASYTPQPGDSFILRGGDTWVASDLGIGWNWSGTSSSPIYIGVDQTWFTGSSWTRPIWTCGGSACSSAASSRGDMIDIGGNTSWVVLDNIEMTGFNTANDEVMVQVYGSNVTVENMYAHGWNHTGESSDSGAVFSGTGCCGGGVNITFQNDIADGSDTTQDSMVCFFGQITNVYNSVCRYVTNGAEGAFDNIHDNWFGPIDFCFPASGCHQNAIQQAGPASSTNNVRVYNNVITGVASGGMGHLWVEQSAVNDGALNTYVFGNVMVNNQPGNDVNICQEGTNCGTLYFFNNTFECGTDANTDDCAPASNSSAGPAMVVHFANNHWISGSGGGIVTGSGSFGSGPYTETTDLEQTVSQANSQGYTSTSAFAFQPTSASGGTVGQGANEQSLCTTINGFDTTAGAACRLDTGYACTYNTSNHTVNCPAHTPVARPAAPTAWDIGAYQYCQGSACAQAPPPLPPPSANASSFSPQVYPNPWRSDKHAGKNITFDGLTTGTDIKIFTVSSHKVAELHSDGPSVLWDLSNDSGDKVASGVYLYVITDNAGDKAKGKLAIIK